MMLAGILAGLGLLLLIFKIGLRKIIAYDIVIDIAVTSLLMVSLAGTYSGMIAALIGGLFVSVVLWVLKKTVTREELRLAKAHVQVGPIDIPAPTFKWVEVNPRNQRSK